MTDGTQFLNPTKRDIKKRMNDSNNKTSKTDVVYPLGDRVWVEEILPTEGLLLNALGGWLDTQNSFVRVRVISVGLRVRELQPGMVAILAKRTLLAMVRKRLSAQKEGWILHEKDIDAILCEFPQEKSE